MKIGIDVRVLYMPVLKGIGIYLYNLLRQISEIDNENEYILYYDSRQNIVMRDFNSKNIKTNGISIKKGDRFDFWEQLRLPIEITKDKVDIFHSPANTTMYFKNCPTIVTVHDTTLQEISNGSIWDNWFFGKLQPDILKGVEKIITPSNHSKNRIEQIMSIPSEKIEVVPNGISNTFRVLEDKSSIKVTKNKYGIIKPYILNVGGESLWKNVSCLINAYHILVKEHNLEAQLVITGIRKKEILEAHFKTIVALDLTGKVIILGYIGETELVDLYNGAEVFVYPSLKEGFGFPPLEAMACGIPVIASNRTSIPEVVGDAAILVDATQPKNISDAVIKVLGDNLLNKRLIESGFRRRKLFDWRKTAEETLNLYEEILKR